MIDTYSIRMRRIGWIANYLRKMQRRALTVVGGPCFCIFMERDPAEHSQRRLRERRRQRIHRRVGSLVSGNSSDFDEATGDEDWREAADSDRYLQFAFCEHCFYLDLPNNTLFPVEAAQIVRHRRHYYYGLSRPDLPWYDEADIRRWNPLNKLFGYGDEESAAEELAYIAFDLWKFPVDSTWFIKAAAFHTSHDFEQRLLLPA